MKKFDHSEVFKKIITRIVTEDHIWFTCDTCMFQRKKIHWGDNIIDFIERPFCSILEEYLDDGMGYDRCEIEHFTKILLEMI